MRSPTTPWSRLTSNTAPGANVRSVCIIGSGSSGLVAARYLRKEGYEATVLEKSSGIGGAFVSKAYDDGHLVSSKYLTAFSDLRIGKEAPPHLSLHAYVRYLNDYADQEQLWSLITFGAKVVKIDKLGNEKGYNVHLEPTEKEHIKGSTTLKVAETRHFDAVCICSGLHEVPYIPSIQGLDTFNGVCLHSCDYKTKSLFRNKQCLIVGCGETGMDLAYRSVQVASRTCISIRNGFLAVPHEGWGGVPLDTIITNLFEHSYEHWFCHQYHLKWYITTVVIWIMFWVMGGTRIGYRQWAHKVPHVKRGYNILCKSTAALPYINRPFQQRSWRWRLVWKWVCSPNVTKSIDSFPAPQSIDGSTVTFTDGRSIDVDVIVLATGYRQTFPFLHDAPMKESTSNETLLPRGLEDPLPSEHFIIDPDEPTLAYIGFVRPNVGAIPPMAELQVMWWIQRLKGKVLQASEPASYGLLGKKLTYGVDYGNYMHQLAAEMGAAPSLKTLAREPRVLIAYCLGQAYISFFRLEGPYSSQHAWKVASTELFEPIRDRGALANLVLGLTCLVFGAMNLAAHAIEAMVIFAKYGWRPANVASY